MKRLWLAFAVVLVFSFSVLGWVGTRIYQEAPPVPDQVVATDGKVVIPSGDIGKGQNVWQAMGGMEVGSIWGHGSYVAPDWSADWLHRECVFILNEWARATYQKDFDQIEPEQQAQLQKRLEILMRTNTFDPATQTITVDPVRAKAFEANLRPLRRRVRQRQLRLCHSQRGAERPRKTSPVGCLLLLDLLGGVHQPSRSRSFLHE